MLKILLGCVIIAFFTFCGYFLSKKYRQRKVFFRQLYDFNQRFLNEIAYYRRPIQEFISMHSYQDEFDILLQTYLSSLKDYTFDLTSYTFLRTEEQSFLLDYFRMLGKGDSSSQKAYFSSVNDRLDKLKTTSEEEGKKYADLYIKLGFLCGLFILILII